MSSQTNPPNRSSAQVPEKTPLSYASRQGPVSHGSSKRMKRRRPQRGLSSRDLCRVFPFHVLLNRQLEIVQIGNRLAQTLAQSPFAHTHHHTQSSSSSKNETAQMSGSFGENTVKCGHNNIHERSGDTDATNVQKSDDDKMDVGVSEDMYDDLTDAHTRARPLKRRHFDTSMYPIADDDDQRSGSTGNYSGWEGASVTQLFRFALPDRCAWTWSNLLRLQDVSIELETVMHFPVAHDDTTNNVKETNHSANCSHQTPVNTMPHHYRGEIVFLQSDHEDDEEEDLDEAMHDR